MMFWDVEPFGRCMKFVPKIWWEQGTMCASRPEKKRSAAPHVFHSWLQLCPTIEKRVPFAGAKQTDSFLPGFPLQWFQVIFWALSEIGCIYTHPWYYRIILSFIKTMSTFFFGKVGNWKRKPERGFCMLFCHLRSKFFLGNTNLNSIDIWPPLFNA